jgi:hypothetical protein
MALQTENIGRLQQIRVILSSVNIMATETTHAVRIHRALNEIVALHPILMRGAVGKMRESLLAKRVLLELPEILEVQPDTEADRPVVVFSADRIFQRLSLRVALNA